MPTALEEYQQNMNRMLQQQQAGQTSAPPPSPGLVAQQQQANQTALNQHQGLVAQNQQPQGLVAQQQQSVPQGNPANLYQSNVTNQQVASGYDVAGYDPTTYTAAQGEAAQGTAITREVQPNELLQHQIRGIIEENSPLIQMARARADTESQRRGLLNSTMAMRAADAEVYNVAERIGTFDATAYGNAARDNQLFQNQMEVNNVDALNRMTATNLGFENEARSFSANAENDAAHRMATATNTMRESVMSAQNAAYANDAAAVNLAARELARAQNDMVEANLDRQFDAQQNTQDRGHDIEIQQMRQDHDEAMEDIRLNSELTRLDKMQIDDIMTDYRSAVSAILESDIENKAEMIQQQRELALDAIAAVDAAMVDEIADLLTWDDHIGDIDVDQELGGNAPRAEEESSSSSSSGREPGSFEYDPLEQGR